MTSIPDEPVEKKSTQDAIAQDEITGEKTSENDAPQDVLQEESTLDILAKDEPGEETPAPETLAIAPTAQLSPDPSRRYETVTYLMIATVFFGLGFMVATVTGINLNGGTSVNTQMEINQAVLGTMIALTPTPLPEPTRAPVETTFSALDYSLGAADAPVTIVEFSDYQCPYCARFAVNTLKPLLEKYDGYMRFVYRDYVIFGEPSTTASLAARCGNEQGQFWTFHDELFIRQHMGDRRRYVDNGMLTSIATDLALDMEDFTACMNDGQQLEVLNSNIYNAYATIGQAGTPTFLVNGKRIEGSLPIESFSTIIDQELILLGIDPPG